ncbi:alkaline phosphatase family protein [Pontiella agarivorans]|uniref:Alkaline phosphatase family protein n=1 Tax=Pontiella agarivorans TaxID=3038953 RepID=A0ABU5MWV4_9BACT|nr:alkaline phosphatase family protein [Pontiella agarivorans]MDZ8118699.1 alkaline phosphatase family protein [Pontiella agarivorans]
MKKKKLSLFLFIDAFGWEVRQRHPEFLHDLTAAAKPLETILGYSSACDPSIISGLTPSEHGLWSSYYYDPEHSPFKWTKPMGFLPGFIFNRGRVRGRLSRWVKKRCGFTGYFQLFAVPFNQLPLFNYAEQKRIWEPDGLPRGTSVFDRMSRQGIPYYVHDSDLPDEQRLEHLRQHIENRSIDFAYCSFGKLDGLMHAKGNNHPDIGKLMAWYDAEFRKLFAAAEKNYEEITWYIFTDHGMHNVTGSYDLMADIQSLELQWNTDYCAFYDSTMARFWFKHENARTTIFKGLENHPQGRILSDDELKQHGVFFEDGQYGELIFLMNSGTQIAPGFMGIKPCAGMHGFDPADADSKAALASNRPIPESVTKIQHIHQLMLNELNLKP